MGAFVVASTGGAAVSHSFALVDGSGSNHNACFKIDGADLLTTKEFDYEAQSSLNIRVQTLASNGFTQATAFTVTVTDVGGASAWVPSLVQPVYASEAAPETAAALDVTGSPAVARTVTVGGQAAPAGGALRRPGITGRNAAGRLWWWRRQWPGADPSAGGGYFLLQLNQDGAIRCSQWIESGGGSGSGAASVFL